MKNLSTRRLKRYYWRWIQKAWYWSKFDGERYITGPRGYDKAYLQVNFCQWRAIAAKEELVHRGMWLP